MDITERLLEVPTMGHDAGCKERGNEMKHTLFIVWFANENYEPQGVSVVAFNQDQAIILAQAERIKAGCDYTLHKVESA